MDKDFIEKLNSLGKWNKLEGKELVADFTIAFSQEDNSIFKVNSDNGEFIYELKPIKELYTQKPENTSVEHYNSLIKAIEGALKRYTSENSEITDSQVINILEKLAMKPENIINNGLGKELQNQLRFELSMSGYSRDDVRQSVRKILKLAQKAGNQGNSRSYLDLVSQNQKI